MVVVGTRIGDDEDIVQVGTIVLIITLTIVVTLLLEPVTAIVEVVELNKQSVAGTDVVKV